MSENKTSVVLPWLPLLGIAFVILKLCGIIDWSWWFVTLPFWAGALLVLGMVVGITVLSLAASAVVLLFQWIVSLFDRRK